MTTLFTGGTVYRGGGAFCTAIAVRDGRVLAVGGPDELRSLFPEAAERSLRGGCAVPGFVDSHMHVLGYGAHRSRLDLTNATGSLTEVLHAVSQAAARADAGEWVVGRGWNEDCFSDERRMPDRADLDAAAGSVPVCVTRACGHAAVCNSAALRLAGIGRDTPDPEGGRIGRDSRGDPTGVLLENAIGLATAAQPRPDGAALRRYLRDACGALAARGITSVQSDDFSAFPALPFEQTLRAWADLEAAGELPVKVWEQAYLPDMETLDRFLAAGLRTGCGSGRFRIGPVKLISDGSLGARTAYLSRPYADAPETRGVPVYSQPRLDALIRRAHEAGMQIAVHAIGDGAVDQVLTACARAQERAPREDARHGIVHCQITRPEQLDAMEALGLHAYIQPVFLDYDTRIVLPRAGAELAETSYAFRTLLRRSRASSGSDCPVERPDPLAGIQCAVTRAPLGAPEDAYRPEEALTVAEAIDSYTANGAYASFEEGEKGRLEPGFAADLTVLEESPFDAPPSRIGGIRVRETWVDGRRTYASEDADAE